MPLAYCIINFVTVTTENFEIRMFTKINIYINKTGRKKSDWRFVPFCKYHNLISCFVYFIYFYILILRINIGNFYLVTYKISHKITLIRERPINCQIAIEAFSTVPKSKNGLKRKGKWRIRTKEQRSSSGIVWNKNIRPILCNKRSATFETPRDTCLLVCTIIPWLAR